MLLTVTTETGVSVDVAIDPSEIDFDDPKDAAALLAAIKDAVAAAIEQDDE